MLALRESRPEWTVSGGVYVALGGRQVGGVLSSTVSECAGDWSRRNSCVDEAVLEDQLQAVLAMAGTSRRGYSRGPDRGGTAEGVPELLRTPLLVSSAERAGVVALTGEQEAVLGCRASQVFVSAAAGSGKTTLLVERYLRAVLDDAVPMEHLPTVTFTRKAAAEMRKRIRQGLLDRGRPELAWGIDEAPIGTIHSLCSRLLRARVIEAGVDPGFRVLDEEQAKILSNEAMNRAWSTVVLDADEAELELLARHGAALRADVPAVYAHLRQLGMAEPRLDPPLQEDLPRERERLREAIGHTVAMLADANLSGRAAANQDAMLQCREWLADSPATWDAILSCTRFTPHLGCSAQTKPAFEFFKQALLQFRGALGREYLVGVHSLADRLLTAYQGAFHEAKRSLGALDFADLELEALALLRRGEPPFEAEARLMVDEFQDTNSLQCAILDRLGVGGTLTVGDPFQSIYSFRGAEVAVFRERLAAVSGVTDEDGRERVAHHELPQPPRDPRSDQPHLRSSSCGSERTSRRSLLPRLGTDERASRGYSRGRGDGRRPRRRARLPRRRCFSVTGQDSIRDGGGCRGGPRPCVAG